MRQYPVPLLFAIRRLFVCWRGHSRRHTNNNSSKRQRSQPNIFTVTVIAVALGRRLYIVFQPPPSLSPQLLIILLTSHRIHQLQLQTCILPGVVLVVRYLKDINSKISGGQRQQKGRSATSKAPKAVGPNPLHFGFRIQQLVVP